jgi:hypothetical protein
MEEAFSHVDRINLGKRLNPFAKNLHLSLIKSLQEVVRGSRFSCSS